MNPVPYTPIVMYAYDRPYVIFFGEPWYGNKPKWSLHPKVSCFKVYEAWDVKLVFLCRIQVRPTNDFIWVVVDSGRQGTSASDTLAIEKILLDALTILKY